MYGWNERPTKAKLKHVINDDHVYEVGHYDVTVRQTEGGEPAVTYKHRYSHTTDPRRTLPNMEVADGEIRIPVTDLVATALSRLDPADLARALWQEDEVRGAFIDCLCHHYNDHGIDDADRRKVLAGLQAAVHSAALDRLASAMHKLEYTMANRSFFYHEVNRINERLAALGCVDAYDQPIRLQHADSDPDYRIGGKIWNEARDDWRKLVLERFPEPEAPAEEASDDPLAG